MAMSETHEAGGLHGPATGRLAGIVLMLTALLTVVAMGHHPSGHEAPGPGLGMTLGGFIHAAMIVLLAGTLWGLVIFSLRERPNGWTVGALLAYGIGTVGNVAAGTINGFVVPALADEVDPSLASEVFLMLWQANQAAAELGIYASSAAFALWSVHLLRRKPKPDVLLGVVGIIVAAGTAGALYSGIISLDISGAQVAYGAQALWTGLVGLQLYRSAR
jgi:hypothetical protein